MTYPQQATVHLRQVSAPVRLGWEAAERAQPQVVSIDLALRFLAPPAACATDDLAGTVDYAALAGRMVEVCRRGEYRLLERLGQALYDEVRAAIPAEIALTVTVTKDPGIPGVDGGAAFSIGDQAGAGGTHA